MSVSVKVEGETVCDSNCRNIVEDKSTDDNRREYNYVNFISDRVKQDWYFIVSNAIIIRIFTAGDVSIISNNLGRIFL